MIRLFRTHRIRKVSELEGLWQFAADSEDGGDKIPDAYAWTLSVPGCWESHPQFADYRGTGWYRKEVVVERRTAARLEFKGVSHTADVYVDGHFAARHYNAYTPFSTVLPELEAGVHEIAVRVNNRFTESSSLHVPNDYYTYGGLSRPVVFEEISDTYIERLEFLPVLNGGGWEAQIRTVVRNLTNVPQSISLAGDLGGRSLDLGRGSIGPNETKIFTTMASFPGITPWSPQDPRLYMLECRLYRDGSAQAVDDLIERVGFRTMDTAGGELRLNGEKIFLRGFCRHEDHPQAGCALPLPMMVFDLDQMQDMQANAVRTTHYPYDERFLDLCDERGVLVWEENHARGLTIEQMEHPLFDEQCAAVNKEMVENHFNHPCIIIWGILNECASHTEAGREKYARQFAQIREMDGSRPVTFASNHHFDDRCLDLVDIVAFNVYPGWYNDDEPGEYADRVLQWAEENGGKNKPLIMSEFGGDGYYGYRARTRVRGSEERQADIIDADLQAFLSRSRISGTFIWQFCDCRVTEGTGWLLARACTRNSKGIVDEYRRPKLAYDTVKAHYARKAADE